MHGILPIDKPKDFTSRDIVNIAMRKFGIKKIGHSGTLDPMATGVLVLCIGKATKAISFLQDSNKVYLAEMKFGIATDTEDIWGRIITKSNSHIKVSQINDAIKNFLGEIEQIPPMYSAKRHNGKRLYQLAREGQIIERKAAKVNILDIKIIDFNEKDQTALLKIHCGKGTYIRSLIRDIAKSLNTIATMTKLRRLNNSGFSIEDCITIDELKSDNIILDKLFDIDYVFKSYKEIQLENSYFKHITNGMTVVIDDNMEYNDKLYRVYCKDLFIGIGSIKGKSQKGYLLKIDKLFI
ncbi:MAG: tRNA pseudouridine(55) synthase TruB [Tissierellia bacterium]|nr:tRNA pseudouridine(55) synthase TruB [Tissierellia bacterium]